MGRKKRSSPLLNEKFNENDSEDDTGGLGSDDADGSNVHTRGGGGGGGGTSEDARRLDIIDSYVTKNPHDLTLKSVSTSKFVVSRHDNHRLIACVAENSHLNEKWETKRILNVLCKISPRLSTS